MRLAKKDKSPSVPNVPCGVERLKTTPFTAWPVPFLMYRVELKEADLPTKAHEKLRS